MPQYTEDKSLEALGKTIIDSHKNLAHLKMIKIAYMFREQAAISQGKVIAGMAIRVDDRNFLLHKKDAMIEIGKDLWDEATPEFRKALMHHELKHIRIQVEDDGTVKMDDKTGRIKVFLAHHDIEEFADVLEEHGAYHKALRDFLLAFAKSKMPASKVKTEETLDAVA